VRSQSLTICKQYLDSHWIILVVGICSLQAGITSEPSRLLTSRPTTTTVTPGQTAPSSSLTSNNNSNVDTEQHQNQPTADTQTTTVLQFAGVAGHSILCFSVVHSIPVVTWLCCCYWPVWLVHGSFPWCSAFVHRCVCAVFAYFISVRAEIAVRSMVSGGWVSR